MPNYRRNYLAGGCYFFTVALAERQSTLLVDAIDKLRSTVVATRDQHPFTINAWVVLPEHLHAIWTLPDNDCDYPLRWRLIKSNFSRSLPAVEYRRESRIHKNEPVGWVEQRETHQNLPLTPTQRTENGVSHAKLPQKLSCRNQ